MNASSPTPNRSGLPNAVKVTIGVSVIGALIVGAVMVHAIAFWTCWGCKNAEDAAALASSNAARMASYGGPPPIDCGTESVSVHDKVAGTIWDEDHVYVGRSPAWLSIDHLAVENDHAVLHLQHSADRGPRGFPIYVEWITNADFADVIHVRVTDTATGSELSAQPAVYMHDPDLLVPSETNAISVGPTPPYRIYVTTVTLPTSPGCYVATASWSDGGWSVGIAVGQ